MKVPDECSVPKVGIFSKEHTVREQLLQGGY